MKTTALPQTPSPSPTPPTFDSLVTLGEAQRLLGSAILKQFQPTELRHNGQVFHHWESIALIEKSIAAMV